MYFLIKLPNWLGDAIMFTPTLSLLHRVFPQAKFVIIGNALSTSIFSQNHYIIKIFADTTKAQKGFFKRLRATDNLARQINRYAQEQKIQTFDYAITAQNNFFSALLLAKISAKQRVGYGDKNIFGMRKFLLTHPVKFSSGRPPLCNHQVLSYINLLLAILPPSFYEERLKDDSIMNSIKKHPHYNIHANMAQNILFYEAKELKIFTHITTKRLHNKKIIAISPGANYGESKMWLAQYFVETIISLVKHGYEIRIYGTSHEVKRNATIYQNAIQMLDTQYQQYIHDLSGTTTIPELINSMNECSIYLGNDSGATHIAKALKIPSIIIFGPMPLAWCSPWSTNAVMQQGDYYYIDSTIAVQKKLPCVPCKKRVCPLQHHNCMKLITPDEILNLIESL